MKIFFKIIFILLLLSAHCIGKKERRQKQVRKSATDVDGKGRSDTCKNSDSGECLSGEESSKSVSKNKSKKQKKEKSVNKDKKKKSKGDKKKKKKRKANKDANKKKGVSKKDKSSNDISKKLLALRDSVDGLVEKTFAQRIMSSLSYKTGDEVVDYIVAIGYILVNTNKNAQCIDLFNKLLEIRQDIPAAYIAYGTALAMSGHLSEAAAAFDAMIRVEPNAPEAYERRAEILQHMGRTSDAIDDLSHIIDSGMGDQHMQVSALVKRGQLYMLEKRPRTAYADFKDCLALAPKNSAETVSKILHQKGKCERELGLTEESIMTQREAIRLNPGDRESYLELSIALLEMSRWKDAVEPLDKAVKLEPQFKMAHGYRGLMYHNLGHLHDALVHLQKAIDLDPNEPSGMLIKAVCLHSLGRMTEASRTFDRMLELAPKHDCFFMREIAYFYYAKMDDDVWTFNADNDVDKKVKEGWSRRLEWTEVFPDGYVSPLQKAARKKMSEEGDRPVAMTAAMRELLHLTAPISKWIQLDHPGFMPNERQHRQYAMAVVQMAQCLRQHTRLLQAGEEGLLIPDVAASSKNWFGFTPSKTKPGFHVFGWRDMFDMAVRWRQVSEPMDTVWWNDRLEIKAGYNQLGLKTHMHHGWTKTVRYGSYIPMGLNITKTLLLSDPEMNAKKGKAIRAASSVEELFKASGGKSFYVNTRVHSLAKPGEAWEGTQVTLQTSTSPEGYDFLINSLVNPARDAQYAQDMDFTFRSFVSSLGAVLAVEGGDPAASDAAFGHALEIFYYWVNYAALTRGTSATGYAALMACVVAMGEQILSPVPKGKQLDWEGIYTMHPADFVHRIKGWLSERDVSNIPKKWLDSEPGYSLTREVFSTTRSMMAVIGKLE